MKLNCFCGFLIALFSLPVFAGAALCPNGRNSECEVHLEVEGEKIFITSERYGRIFDRPEEISVSEDFSLYRLGRRYAVLREGFNSGKDKTIVTFDTDFGHLTYMYLSSEIDFVHNKKYWTGFYCSSEGNVLPGKEKRPLELFYESACKNKLKAGSSVYEYVDKDIFFFIPSVSENAVKSMKLVALGADGGDGVNNLDFGCVEGCPKLNDGLDFTGRINGEKIKMSLDFNEGGVVGYYYYDKYKKNIDLNGVVIGRRITLLAVDKSGRVVEKFGGEIKDGLFSGLWEGPAYGKKVEFELYLSVM